MAPFPKMLHVAPTPPLPKFKKDPYPLPLYEIRRFTVSFEYFEKVENSMCCG